VVRHGTNHAKKVWTTGELISCCGCAHSAKQPNDVKEENERHNCISHQFLEDSSEGSGWGKFKHFSVQVGVFCRT